ncbi:hypothetical protein PMI09_04444 [Rhizobium sp. CF122]|nr:hypothetical protein PMI09_04444 [Rhizobium sp. CF122]
MTLREKISCGILISGMAPTMPLGFIRRRDDGCGHRFRLRFSVSGPVLLFYPELRCQKG